MTKTARNVNLSVAIAVFAMAFAAQAVDAGCAAQDLPYRPLAVRLKHDGQVLSVVKD